MKVCLICIAKKENLYISEWVDWYLNYGFDKIIICDNNDSGDERIADVVKDNDKVEIRETYHDIDKVQCLAYTTEYKRVYKDYDWILFCDVDEFLVLDQKYEHDIHNFLNDDIFKDCDTIRFNWMLFSGGDNLDVIDGDYSVVSRFTVRSEKNPLEDSYAKNIYRTSSVILGDEDKMRAHYCEKSKNIVNAVGEWCKSGNWTGKNICHTNAWLNHYPTKTIGEYIRQKYFRGGPNANPYRYKNLSYFFRYNTETKEKKDYANSLIKILS